jgi:hypothetical protein
MFVLARLTRRRADNNHNTNSNINKSGYASPCSYHSDRNKYVSIDHNYVSFRSHLEPCQCHRRILNKISITTVTSVPAAKVRRGVYGSKEHQFQDRGVNKATSTLTSTTKANSCTIKGLPAQVTSFVCDVLSAACSSIVHPTTYKTTTTTTLSTSTSTITSTVTPSATTVTNTVVSCHALVPIACRKLP